MLHACCPIGCQQLGGSAGSDGTLVPTAFDTNSPTTGQTTLVVVVVAVEGFFSHLLDCFSLSWPSLRLADLWADRYVGLLLLFQASQLLLFNPRAVGIVGPEQSANPTTLRSTTGGLIGPLPRVSPVWFKSSRQQLK